MFAKFVKANVAGESSGGSFRRGVVFLFCWVVDPDGKAFDDFSEDVKVQ